MLRIVSSTTRRVVTRPFLQFSTNVNKLPASHDQDKIFEMYAPGDNIAHNYSLTEDGVVNAGLAYRNASISTMMSSLSDKTKPLMKDGKVTFKNLNIYGNHKISEAGDEVPLQEFKYLLRIQQAALSIGNTLFFEDLTLGTSTHRVGCRIITDQPAYALALRSLLINPRPFETDHRSRYNGWNLNARWNYKNAKFNGEFYEEFPNVPQRGERPVVALITEHGGFEDRIALEFVQNEDKSIAGSNVIAGAKSSVHGIMHALGTAASVVMNKESKDSLTIPSLSLSSPTGTVILAGMIPQSVVESAIAKKCFHGDYYNTLFVDGVAPMFGGAICSSNATPGNADRSASSFTPSEVYPAIVNDTHGIYTHQAHNFVGPAKTIVFFKENAEAKQLSEADAVKELIGLSDEHKQTIATRLVEGCKLHVAGNAEALGKFFQ